MFIIVNAKVQREIREKIRRVTRIFRYPVNEPGIKKLGINKVFKMSNIQGSKLVTQTFQDLKQPQDRVQCMHVYIDGSLKSFRTKSLTWHEEPRNPDDFPLMEFCGSATNFDVGDVADYYAKPVRIFADPFRGGRNKLVFCETYSREGLPTFANNRYRLQTAEHLPKQSFTFYQSYALLRKDGKPLAPLYETDPKWDFGRPVAESHYKACLYAGIKFASLEPVPGRGEWRYSVSVSSSVVELSDEIWMSRFILQRVAEDFGVNVSFEKGQTSLWLDAENFPHETKLRIVDVLLSQFVVKQHKQVQVRNLDSNIVLSHLQQDLDPYVLYIRVFLSKM
ncbi:glutamine synthetase, mitochondrial [Nephila pilipes]|uniref:Glutamine synthetase, mitochondrial n=1 Tax=Nephila pilipes TaxID=299642 RepID=A0A8X6QZD7_NEPPI|nr:glutamine synthetase, mitochondrial [Nephila pilipes]